jgi:hypothetical protein
MRPTDSRAACQCAALAGRFSVYLTALAVSSVALAADGDEFAPLVKIHHEDYAQARQSFHTKLLRDGPSPQPFSAVAVPQGVSEVEYPAGKLQLKAWLSKPSDDSKQHPAVLFLHGGFAFGQGDWDTGQPYRDAGYVVMTPLLRGENGQPGAFSVFYNEIDDVLAAADYLANVPAVDSKRMFIAGPSAGGTLVLLAAMASDHFRAAASFSASPDQVLFCKYAKGAKTDVPIDINDLPELEMRSPLAFAESLKCPARLYYGSQEPQWKLTSQKLAELARGKGLDVEAIEVEGDHSSSVKPGILQSIKFFDAR